MSAPTITRQAVLRRAAEILQANGRTVETYYDVVQHEDENVPIDQCRMCVMGALGHAAGADLTTVGLVFPASQLGFLTIDAGRALLRHLGMPPASDVVPAEIVVPRLGIWNDDPGTTDAEVLAALNATADALDAAQEA